LLCRWKPERGIEERGPSGTDAEARLLSRHLGVQAASDGADARPDPDDMVFSHGPGMSPGMVIGDCVTRPSGAFPRCDTITVEPHEAGFVPYAAGTPAHRDGAMREVVAFTAPVVFHGGTVPGVGVDGIEGWKPGAAAGAVYMSHAVIPADRTGHGLLLAKCILGSKRFYRALPPAFEPEDDGTLTPFQRLPAERSGGRSRPSPTTRRSRSRRTTRS
jgi:hypothetical protein